MGENRVYCGEPDRMAKRFKKMRAGSEFADAKITGSAGGPEGETSLLRGEWLWGLALVLAVFLTYLPVWWGGFVWDDEGHVTANLSGLGSAGLREIWAVDGPYRAFPLVITGFGVEHGLWGMAPLPYHLVNVLEHAACAVLLWQVLERLRVPGAWLGAALWALHPLQVESVAWIAEMKNTQSCLFYLLTVLFFLRGLRAEGKPMKGGWSYALTLIFAALAMASKSSTAVLPVVLALCAWWTEGRWHWRHLVRLAPICLMSIMAVAVTVWPPTAVGTAMADPEAERNWLERVATSGDVIWFYLGKLLWPYPLMAIYPRWQIDAGRWFSYLPLLAAMAVLVVSWIKRERWARPLFFALAYYLVALSPFLGLIDQSFWHYSFVEDHLQYLASMGPLALAGAALVALARWVIPREPWLQSSVCAGVLLIFGILSWQRASVYQSEKTLWTDTLAKNPLCWLAYNELGVAFDQEGREEEAMAEFNQALGINSTYAQAHYNLATVLLRIGRVDDAIAEFEKTLSLNRNDAHAHYNLGNALVRKGEINEAMAEYQLALKVNPKLAEARNNLGMAFAQTNRMDDAIAEYQQALAINPNYAEAYYNLGNACYEEGKADEAVAQYERGLAIDPNNAVAHCNVGNMLLQTGRVDEAIDHFREALRLNPQDSNAQKYLAGALAVERQGAPSK